MKAALTIMGALAIAWSTGAEAASKIGVASVVVQDVTGTLSGPPRHLKTGVSVFQNEAIASGQSSRAQLLFIDETVFNIGANSRVVLDRFIYNPRQKTGQIIMNVTRGAFRFISGAARPSSYTIKTPVATISVRGTIFNGNLNGTCSLDLNLQQGALLVCPRPGATVEGQSPGQQDQNGCTPVTSPGPVCVNVAGGGGDPGTDPTLRDPDPNDPADSRDPRLDRGSPSYGPSPNLNTSPD